MLWRYIRGPIYYKNDILVYLKNTLSLPASRVDVKKNQPKNKKIHFQ